MVRKLRIVEKVEVNMVDVLLLAKRIEAECSVHTTLEALLALEMIRYSSELDGDMLSPENLAELHKFVKELEASMAK